MSKTRLRELRRTVRNAVGTSSEPVPELGQVLRAVVAVEEMLQLTSGRYRHVLLVTEHAERVTPREALSRHVAAINERQRIEHERRMAELRAQRQEGQG